MNIIFPKNKYNKNIYWKEIMCKKLAKTKLNYKLIKVKIKTQNYQIQIDGKNHI